MKTELYYQLETAIRNQNAEQVIKQSPTSDDIRVVIRQIMRDNPDIYFGGLVFRGIDFVRTKLM